MGRGRRQGSAAAEEEDTDSISSHTTAARGEEGGMGKGRDVTKSQAIKCDGGEATALSDEERRGIGGRQ